MSKAFNEVWSYLHNNLHAGISIHNWTVLKGHFGEDMKIRQIYDDAIAVDTPGAKNTQFIPSYDFEAIWEIWADYNKGLIQRQEIRDMTRFSKYIISIFRWYDLEQKQIDN